MSNRQGLGQSIRTLSKAVYESIHKWQDDEDMPDNLNENDVKFTLHFQTWASTACGFGGMGGAAMTDAPCVVVRCAGRARVYHAYALAYEVICYNDEFMKDLQNWSLDGQNGYDGERYERYTKEEYEQMREENA